MAHSVELLLDDAGDEAVRSVWEALVAADLPSQGRHTAPSNRPHVTVIAAPGIDGSADPGLLRLAQTHLPVSATLGAPLVFGSDKATIALSVVLTVEVLAVHADVVAVTEHARAGLFEHCAVGAWTPHVTIARRVRPHHVADVLAASASLAGQPVRFEALRRWDSDAAAVTEFPARGD